MNDEINNLSLRIKEGIKEWIQGCFPLKGDFGEELQNSVINSYNELINQLIQKSIQYGKEEEKNQKSSGWKVSN